MTWTVNVFAPTDSSFKPRSATGTIAAPLFVLAPIVVLVTLFATLAVYDKVPLANTGLSVTPFNVSALKEASELVARVTVTVYSFFVTPSSAVT
ncbi:hypothetical protein D3C71_1245020 [compost metagenome]